MTPPLANPPCASQLETAVNLTDRRLLFFPFVDDSLPVNGKAAMLCFLRSIAVSPSPAGNETTYDAS